MTEAAVEVIQAADRQRGVATLTLAFATDPVMRWGWPDPYRYATYWPPIADAFGGRAFDHGTAHELEDCLAVALWLPPGVEPDGETVMGLMRESMNDQTFEDINEFFEQMEELHPSDDHWYLPLTGVDPMAQGRRLGSALLQHALAICDADGLPAYLEATSPRSRNLYARHGFKDVGVIQAGSSPPMWAMLREPAP
jgi:GNAT superfamily N-acetyltransferase